MSTQHRRFNPFPGLRPFWTHEKHLFFGRETQTRELVERLRADRFLAALGPSGSGKSSLVRAGVIPSLYGGGLSRAGSHWTVITFRPGADPLSSLAEAVSDSDLYEERVEDLLMHVRTTLARSALGLVRVVEQSALAEQGNLLMVVDQFEELFRFAGRQTERRGEADAFVNLLLEASRHPGRPIYVVLTMRSDFLGDCSRFAGLAEAVNRGQYLIPRLNRDQWRLAIEGPVRVGGGEIAPRLVQRLLTDVADDPDQLPILQHALMRTWDHWIAHGTNGERIDLPHYEAIGGMQEALSRHADEVYDSLPDERHRHVAQLVFRALTEKAADNRGIRRPASLRVLTAVTRASSAELGRVVDAFRGPNRTFLMPGGAEPLDSETVIDISHESLMRVWRRMRDWVEGEAQSVRVYRRLVDTASLWETGQAGLYRDPDLGLALAWQAENRPHAAWAEHYRPGFDLAMRFLETSRQAEETARSERELARRRALEQAQALAEAERRRCEERTRAARRLGIAAIALLGLAVLAIWAAWKASREERRASAREIAAEAQARLGVDPLESLALVYTQGVATAGMRSGGRVDIVIQDALRQSLFASRTRHQLLGHTDAVQHLAISSDGRWLATAGDDGTVRVWRADSGLEQYCLTNHVGSSLATIAFRPGGDQLLSVDFRPRIQVWDMATGMPIHALPEAPSSSRVTSAAWSADGGTIALGGENGAVWLWQPSSNRLDSLAAHAGKTLHLAFSNDGRYLASAGEQGGVQIVDLLSRSPASTWQAHSNSAVWLAFSPDPDRPGLVTAGYDGTARLWDLQGGLLTDHRQGAEVEQVAFSPSGDRLVSASRDGTAHVWSPDGSVSIVLSGHQGIVATAAFSPDGHYVVTAGHDGTARIWSAESGGELAVLLGHRAQLNGAAFLANGSNLVTISSDGTGRIWETPIARTARLQGYEQGQTARAAAFAQDGERVAVRNRNNELAVYAALEEPLPWPVTAINGVESFRVSPDQTRLLLQSAASASPSLQLWDLASGLPPVPLPISGDLDRAVVFSADSSCLLIATPQATIERWILPSNAPPRRLGDPLGLPGITNIQQLFQGGDGTFIVLKATRDSGTVQLEIRHLNSGQPLAAFPGSVTDLEGLQVAVAPRPPLTLLVGNAAGQIFLWDWTIEGGSVHGRKAHRDAVLAVGFDPSGAFGFSASSDTTLAVWSIRTGREIGRLSGHTGFVRAARFASNSASILTLGNDGRLIQFSLPECLPWERVARIAKERLDLME